MTCKDPISTVVRKGDTVRTKRCSSQPSKTLGNINTGTIDHALIKMQFSICALHGLRPWAEFYLAVKRPNFVPVPIFIPSGFKHGLQTAHQNQRGGKLDASLLKEPSTAHHAKQGGNSPTQSPLQPRRHRSIIFVPLTFWDGARQQGELFVLSLSLHLIHN